MDTLMSFDLRWVLEVLDRLLQEGKLSKDEAFNLAVSLMG